VADVELVRGVVDGGSYIIGFLFHERSLLKNFIKLLLYHTQKTAVNQALFPGGEALLGGKSAQEDIFPIKGCRNACTFLCSVLN
jgi:hypothetical protein